MDILIRPSVWPRLVVSVISLLFIAKMRLVSAISGSVESDDLVVIVEGGAADVKGVGVIETCDEVDGSVSSSMWRREDTSRFPAKGRSEVGPPRNE